MLRAVVNLFARWRVTDKQAAILLDVPVRTWARWKVDAPGRLSRDGKTRLSNLMGIHKALRIIFGKSDRAYEWINAPNAAYGGCTALEVMLRGDLSDIVKVRRHLDADRGGW